jgi:hypothetical protein
MTDKSRKVVVGFKLGIPAIVPGLAAEIEARYEADRRGRHEQLLGAVTQRAGLTLEQLGEILSQPEAKEVRNIFHQATTRAAEVTGTDYIEAIGRLVGAACDGARIDEAAYLSGQVLRLEPVHLRCIFAMYIFLVLPQTDDRRHDQYVDHEGEVFRRVDTPEEAEFAERDVVSQGVLADELEISEYVATAVVAQLEAAGFVDFVNRSTTGRVVVPSAQCGAAMELMFPSLRIKELSPHAFAEMEYRRLIEEANEVARGAGVEFS